MIPEKVDFDNTLEEVTKALEYRILYLKNYISDLIVKVREAFLNWIVEFSEGVGWDISPSISNNISNILIVISFISIVAIIIFLIIVAIRSFDKEVRIREILGEKIGSQTTPQSLRDKAIGLKDSGELRGAIRYEFIALLYLMHKKSILYLDKTQTNQEIYYHLKEEGFSKLDIFKELISIFNLIWYGHKPLKNQTYNKWDYNFNLLWNEVLEDE